MKKTIFITGANRGLGKACSIQLVNDGHKVIATSRIMEKGTVALQEINNIKSNADITFYELDVNSTSSIENCLQQVSNQHQHIDCLINCAGISTTNNFQNSSKEELTSTVQTNLLGPYWLSQSFIPLLSQSSDAKIINVSSLMGSLNQSGPGYAAYRISKTALNSMTRVMSHDLKEQGIKVFCVCPGWVHTDMGGPNAPRTPVEGAKSILYPFYSSDAESGNFYKDGELQDW